MALLRRQDVNWEIIDDQSLAMWNSYVGNWTRYTVEGYYGNTITTTATPGSYFTLNFTGTQAWLYGNLSDTTRVDGEYVTYPTADYSVDSDYAGFERPWMDDRNNPPSVIYFQTSKLAYANHTIVVKVTAANETNQFIVDFVSVSSPADGSTPANGTSGPSSTATSSGTPAVAKHATPVGAIAGGVVGGIVAVAILVIVVWYFLKKRSRGRAYYYQNSSPADILADEGHVEPFNATGTTPAPSFLPLPQPNQPGPGDTGGIIHASGNTVQSSTGKAALMTQQYRDTRRSVQYEDSGIRLGENGERGAGPPQPPNEVPPSYTPQ